MCYSALKIARESDTPSDDVRQAMPGWQGLTAWFDQELDRECSKKPGRHSFISWYNMSILEKIKKLNQMLNFLEYNIPEMRKEEEAQSENPSPAAWRTQDTQGEDLDDFRNMSRLKNVLVSERSRWENKLAERQQQGVHISTNSAYTGFPPVRHYQGQGASNVKPQPPVFEDLEAYGPIPVRILQKEPVKRDFTGKLQLMPLAQRDGHPDAAELAAKGLHASRD